MRPERLSCRGDRLTRAGVDRVAALGIADRIVEHIGDVPAAVIAQQHEPRIDRSGHRRGERPGVMFADWELIGVPLRVTVGDRGLKEGLLEVQARRDGQTRMVPAAEAAQAVRQALGAAPGA